MKITLDFQKSYSEFIFDTAVCAAVRHARLVFAVMSGYSIDKKTLPQTGAGKQVE